MDHQMQSMKPVKLSNHYNFACSLTQMGTEKETVMTLMRKFITLQDSDTVCEGRGLCEGRGQYVKGGQYVRGGASM